MDLLEYAQKLASQGNNPQSQNAHKLQELIQGNSAKVPKKQSDNSNNAPLLVGGLVIFGILAVAIGYW